jgi:hypothetical protein
MRGILIAARPTLLLLATLAVASCTSKDVDAVADRVTTAEERAFHRGIIDFAIAGHTDSILRFVGPAMGSPAVTAAITGVVTEVARQRPDSLILIGVNVSDVEGAKAVNLIWEYQIDSAWFGVNVAALHRANRIPELTGFNWRPLAKSQR